MDRKLDPAKPEIRHITVRETDRWEFGESWDGDRKLTDWMRLKAEPPPSSIAEVLLAEERRLARRTRDALRLCVELLDDRAPAVARRMLIEPVSRTSPR